MSIIPVGEKLSKNPFVRRATVNLLRLVPDLAAYHSETLYRPLPHMSYTRSSCGRPVAAFGQEELDDLIEQAIEFYWPLEAEKPPKVIEKQSCVYAFWLRNGLYKIGATKDLQTRLRTHSGLRAKQQRPTLLIMTTDPFTLERHLHAQLKPWRVGRKELFRLPKEVWKWVLSLSDLQDGELPTAPWSTPV